LIGFHLFNIPKINTILFIFSACLDLIYFNYEKGGATHYRSEYTVMSLKFMPIENQLLKEGLSIVYIPQRLFKII